MERHSWEVAAASKKNEIFGKIPKEGVLEESILENARNQRQLTGQFIEGLLDHGTKWITSLSSVDLVEKISNRSLTASEVARAFCRRTAIAHQIVRRYGWFAGRVP